MVVEKIRRRLVGTKVHELMDAHPEFKEHGRRSLETLSTVKTLMERGVVPNDVTADYGSDLGDVKEAIWALKRRVRVDPILFHQQKTDALDKILKERHQYLESILAEMESHIAGIMSGNLREEHLDKTRRQAVDLAKTVMELAKIYRNAAVLKTINSK
ncbi:MAG: hypothetical protein GXN93_02885 [Candidatus Diapherotrites archaeon]|nr:hypothetical protein [Candidatus Diapherotrites archaeon]